MGLSPCACPVTTLYCPQPYHKKVIRVMSYILHGLSCLQHTRLWQKWWQFHFSFIYLCASKCAIYWQAAHSLNPHAWKFYLCAANLRCQIPCTRTSDCWGGYIARWRRLCRWNQTFVWKLRPVELPQCFLDTCSGNLHIRNWKICITGAIFWWPWIQT